MTENKIGRESYMDIAEILVKDRAKRMENEPMTAEEKKRDLYLRQKELLDTFLENGAISRAQYDKSLGDLTVKMGMQQNAEPKV